MAEYKRLDRKLMHKGSILSFYADTMEFPNGNTAVWDFLEHKGAAAVVAEDVDGKIIMVRQYRASIEQELLEIPAGGLEPGEEMSVCAMRELEEETGYHAGKCEHLFDIYDAPAYCNEKLGIYIATQLTRTHQNLDENEYVDVERYTIDELTEMILTGKITDAKTIASLMAYRAKKEKRL